MIRHIKKQNSGFIALMSAVILSAVLLLIATNLSFTGFFDRSNILDGELKKRSSALAEACADSAILKLVNNPSYNPVSESITVGGDPCIIQSVAGNNPKTISIQTNYRNYITKLRIIINSSTFVIASWEEI